MTDKNKKDDIKDNFETDFSEFDEFDDFESEKEHSAEKSADHNSSKEVENTSSFDDDFDFSFDEEVDLEKSENKQEVKDNEGDFIFDEPESINFELKEHEIKEEIPDSSTLEEVDDVFGNDFDFPASSFEDESKTDNIPVLNQPIGTEQDEFEFLEDYDGKDHESNTIESTKELEEEIELMDDSSIFDAPKQDEKNENDGFDFDFDTHEEPVSLSNNDQKKEDDLLFEEDSNDSDDFLFDEGDKKDTDKESSSELDLDSDSWLDSHIDNYNNETLAQQDKKPEKVSQSFAEEDEDFFMTDHKEGELFALDETQDMVNNDHYSEKTEKDTSTMAKNNNHNDFDLDNDYPSKEHDHSNENFDNDFSFEENDENEDDKNEFGFPNNSSEEDDDTEESTVEEEATSEKPAEKSKAKKYIALALGSLLLAGGGAYLYTSGLLGGSSMDDEDDQPVQTQPVKHTKQQAQTPKKDNSLDIEKELASLDTNQTPTPVKKPISQAVSNQSAPIASIDNSKVNDMQQQLNGVVGQIRDLNSTVKSTQDENARLRGLVEQVKNNNNSELFSNFQVEFNNLRSDLDSLKDQVSSERDNTKDTMMKFLTISKRLKDEIEGLKNSQLDKDAVDKKLQEIDNLRKELDLLNTKMSNTEVLTQIGNLQKAMTDNKLEQVQKEITKTNADKGSSKSSNGKKSVLELLETKNNATAQEATVEEDEPLTVPLSVTISDDSDKPTVKKQTVKAKPKNNYSFVGTIEGVVYLKNSAGSIVDYREHQNLPGYGEIIKIYNDGSIETENGNVKFSNK